MNQKLNNHKAIVVDDESWSQDVLVEMINEYCPSISIEAVCSNLPDAVRMINTINPDVVFLDIEMPMYSGLQIREFITTINFEIVFVTAYDKYAIKAFELSALDYLLKPVELDRLENVINKLDSKRKSHDYDQQFSTLLHNLSSTGVKKIAIPVGDGLVFKEISDIIVIDAEGSYSKIHFLSEKPLLVSKRLMHFERLLQPFEQFYRLHRSHLINLDYLKKYDRHESIVLLENDLIRVVPRASKQSFESSLRK